MQGAENMATKQNLNRQQLQSFQWQGVDNKGNKQSGELSALSLNLAKAQLRHQGITPHKVRRKSRPLFGLGEKQATSKDIMLFTRQLSTMIRAGIPLIQSLNIVAEGLENPAMQRIVVTIRNEVADGNMLSSGLRKQGKHFDKLFCNLIEAGEQAGALETMLDRVALYQEKTERLQAKVKKALYYPIAVLTVGIIVTLILLLKVVPQFESLFKGFNAELPWITQVVINTSVFVEHYWWSIIIALMSVSLILVSSYKKSEDFAYKLDALSLKLPIIGNILKKSTIARFSRTLSTSFSAGVPLVESMRSSAGAADNRVYRKVIFQARDSIATGQQLNFALKASHRFPAVVTQMVLIGEESGSLDCMLDKVADLYEQEVDDAVENMTTLLEPMVISFLGVLVSGMVLAMYLPMFKMGSLF